MPRFLPDGRSARWSACMLLEEGDLDCDPALQECLADRRAMGPSGPFEGGRMATVHCRLEMLLPELGRGISPEPARGSCRMQPDPGASREMGALARRGSPTHLLRSARSGFSVMNETKAMRHARTCRADFWPGPVPGP